MSNSFFNFTTPFNPGTTVRSDGVNSQFNAVEAGFELSEVLISKKLAIHPDATVGSLEIPNVTVANSLLMFDANSNLVIFDKTNFDVDVEDTATAAAAAIASASAASTSEDNASTSAGQALLSAEYAIQAEDTYVTGTTNYSAYHWMKKAELIAGGTAPDSVRLGGELPSFYAEAAATQAALNTNKIFALAGMVM